MWVLVIVMLAPAMGTTQLETFANYRACAIERSRIGFAMAEAYPYEMDFIIECQYKAKEL